MRIVEIIHDADHPKWSNLDQWVGENPSFNTRKIEFYQQWQWPKLHSFDLLILHGGSQHLWNKYATPWLYQEIDFVKETLAKGLPVLGFCLGSQIIAEALGVKVYPSPRREVGWRLIKIRKKAQAIRS